jgi:predicted GIY-YIG superfamily endonuclease
MMTQEGYLYRHYDASGCLLYVGISIDPLKRQYQHFKTANWRALIQKITIETFASREAACEAEATAIRDEKPKLQCSSPSSDRRL